MAELNPLSFEDLLDAARHKKSTATKKRNEWTILVGEIEKFIGEKATDNTHLINGKAPWRITNIRVQGFRGIAAHLDVALDPTPGITVVHGANGSGKSSLCHATEVALRQNTSDHQPTTSGSSRSGQRPIWDPVLTAVGHDEARVTIMLTRRNQQLELTWRGNDDFDGQTEAILTDPDGTSQNVSMDFVWRSAVDAYLPTYAYADWERSLSTAKDLQQYLEQLLALGGCYETLSQHFEERIETLSPLVKQAEASRAKAQEELTEEAKRYSHSPEPFQIPQDLSDDPEEWFSSLRLADQEDTTQLTLDFLRTIRAISQHTIDLSSLREQIGPGKEAQALSHLKDLAQDPSYSSDECPVCGTHTDWRRHLTDRIQREVKQLERMKEWREAVTTLNALTGKFPEETPDTANYPTIGKIVRLSRDEDLAQLSEATEDALCAFDSLTVACTSPSLGAELEAAEEAGSEVQQWQRVQRRIATEIRTAWRKDREAWVVHRHAKVCRDRLNDLGKDLRKVRTIALQNAVGAEIQTLLGDAGIQLEEIDIQKRIARLALRNDAGHVMDPGMLSAGQRNVAILAPALAVARNGPFGFMILDDPVHAFDELRIDLVSRTLSAIAKHRRLIVLTHDERLKEHLVTADPNVDLRAITRGQGGTVCVTEDEPMWSTLIKDARALLKVAGPTATRPITNRVRGLCRQSVDNALRLLVVREAAETRRDPEPWFNALDAAHTTKARFRAVNDPSMRPSTLDAIGQARKKIREYEKAWNQAAHGNPPESNVDPNEIAAAESAGKILTAARHV